MIYETPKPNTPYSKTKAKAMWRRLSTQLHRLAAAANISSTRGRLSGHPPYPLLAPSLPITVQRLAS
ncbi:hypothetical protein LOK49_Contig11G00017 [Camellia lanceoleosa]|nr:hypothetical protein LOK49_Contig11G00017 [Camellia lanceoleosa]